MKVKTTRTKSSGRETQKNVLCHVCCLLLLFFLNCNTPWPLVNKTLHLRCKHQYRVEVLHLREHQERWIIGGRAIMIMTNARSSFLAASA